MNIQILSRKLKKYARKCLTKCKVSVNLMTEINNPMSNN